jgi:hypothetical protein
MLIKQLWPVIKTRVKDPVLLLNTVNQCVAGSKSPEQPFINDIELITNKEQFNNKSAS